jgi:hypothetical protein
MELKVN